MPTRALILSEEQGNGGIQTALGQLRSALTQRGWVLDQVGVRAQRPSLLTLVQQAQQADVLIASNNFLPAYWAVLLGLLAHRPAVVWVHGPLSEVLQHSAASAVKKGFLQGIYNLAHSLVFASQTSLESFERAMPGVRQPQRQVIHNPAPALALGAAAKADTRTVQLGFVGRLASEKRPDWLLQTLACLPTYCHLSIVGDGPLKAALEQQLQFAPPESRLAGRVHFLGEQVVTADTYRQWQTSVLCSAYEGYPMVALESLAAGVPCVATPLPALREMLASDAPHWIAAEDSPASLAHTLLSSLQTPEGSRQMLAQRVAARHPAQQFGQRWHELLSTLPAQASSRPPTATPHLPIGSVAVCTIAKSVHFVHTGNAYLPELAAYREALTKRGHTVHVHHDPASVPEQADVVWWLCGRVSRQHTQRLARSQHVHEYASASVGRGAWLKDRIKQFSHPRPKHRIFQSEWVRQRMGLSDAVPYSLRDMGVPAHFLTARAGAPGPVDLVYLGEMSRLMKFLPALKAIDQAGLRLLLIGEILPALQSVIDRLKYVRTTGRIAQDEVPAQLLRAHAGLNLVPDVLPLSAQTSTKLLEYLAVGLPVISAPSAWAMQTAAEHPGRVQLMTALNSPSAWQQAMARLPAPEPYRLHLQHLSWDARLQRLPLWQALGL